MTSVDHDVITLFIKYSLQLSFSIACRRYFLSFFSAQILFLFSVAFHHNVPSSLQLTQNEKVFPQGSIFVQKKSENIIPSLP